MARGLRGLRGHVEPEGGGEGQPPVLVGRHHQGRVGQQNAAEKGEPAPLPRVLQRPGCGNSLTQKWNSGEQVFELSEMILKLTETF